MLNRRRLPQSTLGMSNITFLNLSESEMKSLAMQVLQRMSIQLRQSQAEALSSDNKTQAVILEATARSHRKALDQKLAMFKAMGFVDPNLSLGKLSSIANTAQLVKVKHSES